MFSWWKNKPTKPMAGIPALAGEQNHYLQQILGEHNLNTALTWLLKQSAEQDHSDVWAYHQHWKTHKANLQQRVAAGLFCFQPVREVEITDEQGHRQRREIRCAEDRLLIRAIAQVLKPLLGDALPRDCMHLAGKGGSKAAVAQVQAYSQQHPDHYVIQSDVKSYYASIDHMTLHQQLHQLLPNEETLKRLLWNSIFSRRWIRFRPPLFSRTTS